MAGSSARMIRPRLGALARRPPARPARAIGRACATLREPGQPTLVDRAQRPTGDSDLGVHAPQGFSRRGGSHAGKQRSPVCGAAARRRR